MRMVSIDPFYFRRSDIALFQNVAPLKEALEKAGTSLDLYLSSTRAVSPWKKPRFILPGVVYDLYVVDRQELSDYERMPDEIWLERASPLRQRLRDSILDVYKQIQEFSILTKIEFVIRREVLEAPSIIFQRREYDAERWVKGKRETLTLSF